MKNAQFVLRGDAHDESSFDVCDFDRSHVGIGACAVRSREDCSVESKLVNATTAVGEISGLPGDQGGTKIDPVLGRRYTGSPMLRLLLAPQKDGILLGEVVIHADNAGMAGIKGSVEGTSSFEFQASFPNQAYDFKGQICGDRLSGTFVATPSGAHGTWSAAVQPWEKNHG